MDADTADIWKTRIALLAVCSLSVFTLLFLPDSLLTGVRSQVRRSATPRATPTPRYSEFPHDVAAHKIDCSSCHKFPSENWNKVRTGDAAFPDITDYPKHESCLSCHKQQFFRGRPPVICSICHTNPGPRNSARHPFPNPRELFDLSTKGKNARSDFAVQFPHDKHIDIVSSNRSLRVEFANAGFTRIREAPLAEESCKVCHQSMKPQGDSPDEYFTPPPPKLGDGFWLKKGTFKSTPLGHTTCFTCHSADSGLQPEPSSCATCHKLKPQQPPADFDPKLAEAMKINDKPMLDAWRRRDSSGKFQHDFVAHVDMECASCHTVTTMNTADPATKRVLLTSCAMCHVTATSADGGALNFELDARKADPKFQCTKCHVAFGTRPVPRSHLDAVEAAGK